jgi:hypothetical protein
LTIETGPTINEVYLWKKNLEEAFDHLPAGDIFTKKMANVFAKSIKELFLTSEAQKIDILFNDLFKMANVFVFLAELWREFSELG